MRIPAAGLALSNWLPRKLSFRDSEIVNALLKKSGKGGSHTICNEEPKQGHDRRPRKPARIHEDVKEEDIGDHWTEKS